MRITQKDLEALVKRINKIHGFDNPEYSEVGSYDLSYAYGGVSLHKYESEHGAVSEVFRCGHTTKKDLYFRMNAYITGLEEK